jgi:hypothetical protein
MRLFDPLRTGKSARARRTITGLRSGLVLACILLLSVSISACSAGNTPGFDSQFKAIVQPYSFNFARWELNTLKSDVKRQITSPLPASTLNSTAVVSYFSAVDRLNNLKSASNLSRAVNGQPETPSGEANLTDLERQISELKPAVEQTLARQISQVLADQGIYNPFNSERLKLTFPAVKFKLEKPLNLLVVSRRDKIERVREAFIRQDVTAAQIEAIESSVAGLNVSALIIPIGGLGATYPTFVIDDADLRFTLNAAIEEWLHQYLAFKPLGFAYVLDLLGISANADITALNETVAGVAAQELGTMVYERYYAQFYEDANTDVIIPPPSGFDFNGNMRQIRQKVDLYLARGQVEEAEKYMQDRQQYLAENGYYVRKLNQAYFAFYGSYTYSPSSIDPLGEQVKTLRKNSSSLKEFMEQVSGLKSRQDLNSVLNKPR